MFLIHIAACVSQACELTKQGWKRHLTEEMSGMGGHRSEMILEIESRGEQSRWDKCVPVELWGSTEDGEAHHEDMFTVTWRFLSAIGWIWRGASRPWVLRLTMA